MIIIIIWVYLPSPFGIKPFGELSFVNVRGLVYIERPGIRTFTKVPCLFRKCSGVGLDREAGLYGNSRKYLVYFVNARGLV